MKKITYEIELYHLRKTQRGNGYDDNGLRCLKLTPIQCSKLVLSVQLFYCWSLKLVCFQEMLSLSVYTYKKKLPAVIITISFQLEV